MEKGDCKLVNDPYTRYPTWEILSREEHNRTIYVECVIWKTRLRIKGKAAEDIWHLPNGCQFTAHATMDHDHNDNDVVLSVDNIKLWVPPTDEEIAAFWARAEENTRQHNKNLQDIRTAWTREHAPNQL